MTTTARYDDPHYVYWHYDANRTLIYVGMTVDPEHRPYDTKRRSFLKKSTECVVSPPMSREAAAVVERETILNAHPKHNRAITGWWVEDAEDWRIRRIMDAEGVTKNTAKWAVRYFPTDPDEFEAFLAQRVAALAGGPKDMYEIVTQALEPRAS